MILAMMGAVTLAIIVAITIFIAATIISIVFAAQRKQRREQGKKLGALIALPIALYTVSIPLLIVFSAAIFIPFFKAVLPSPTKIAHKQLFRTTSNS